MKLNLATTFLYNLTFSKLKKNTPKTINNRIEPLCFKNLRLEPNHQVKTYKKICFLTLVVKIISKTKVESGLETTVNVNSLCILTMFTNNW